MTFPHVYLRLLKHRCRVAAGSLVKSFSQILNEVGGGSLDDGMPRNSICE